MNHDYLHDQVTEITRMTTQGFVAIHTRLNRLENKLENHIKVPSWWDKETDSHLDEAEGAIRDLEDRVAFLEQRLDGMQ